jgi:hypothetical protein
VRGGRKGQEFPLEDGNNSSAAGTLETGVASGGRPRPDDPEAKIRAQAGAHPLEGGKITVEDIGTNGTYVNRQRVDARQSGRVENG